MVQQRIGPSTIMPPIVALVIMFCLFNNACFIEAGRNSSTLKNLMADLKSDYGDVSVPPVLIQSEPVIVYFRMLLYELIEFDQTHQKVTLRSNMRLIWRDEYLQWDPAEYDGIENITLKISEVWRPDLSLDQNVWKEHISIAENYLLVRHTGYIDWLFPAITTSACKVNVRYFPYDKQQCNLTFYPWTLDSTKMRLFALHGEDSFQERYVPNGIWINEDNEVLNHSIQYPCCPFPNDHVTYAFTFRRQSSFFTLSIVVPACFLMALMLIGFWLHPDSGEKVTFAVTNLLALIVFQQLVADYMPPIGEPKSILVTCFFNLIALSVFTVMVAVLVLRLYHHDTFSAPPRWAFQVLRPYISRAKYAQIEDIYFAACTEIASRDITASTLDSQSSLGAQTSGAATQFNQSTEDREPSRAGFSKVVSSTCASGSVKNKPGCIGFLWKQLAHAFEKACANFFSMCIVACIAYAVIGFQV